jgi:hypothetical protein
MKLSKNNPWLKVYKHLTKKYLEAGRIPPEGICRLLSEAWLYDVLPNSVYYDMEREMDLQLNTHERHKRRIMAFIDTHHDWTNRLPFLLDMAVAYEMGVLK